MAKKFHGKPLRLGGGGRFAMLKSKLGRRKGVSNPGALAAWKYGNKGFAALSHKR